MFQTFHETARPEQGPPRLKALRGELASDLRIGRGAGFGLFVFSTMTAWQ